MATFINTTLLEHQLRLVLTHGIDGVDGIEGIEGIGGVDGIGVTNGLGHL